ASAWRSDGMDGGVAPARGAFLVTDEGVVPRGLLAPRRHVAARARQRHPASPSMPDADLAAARGGSLAAYGCAGRGAADQPHAVRDANEARGLPGLSRGAEWLRLRTRELQRGRRIPDDRRDRKSTRLNSSH